MARPRIKQFADDLKIDYGKAKGLVEEGRRRKDGGSQVLEKNMNKMQKKVTKVAKGLKKASKTHAKQAETLDSVEFQAGGTLRDALEKLNRREKDIAKMADIATKDTEIDVNVDKGPKDANFLSYDTVKPKRPKKKKSKHGRKKAMGGATDVGAAPQARGAGAAVRGTKFSGVY